MGTSRKPAGKRDKAAKPGATAETASAPSTAGVLAGYEARRAAFEAAREALDARAEALMRRYVSALFRAEAGLNLILLCGFQDYDTQRLRGQAYITTDLEYAWENGRFEGPCPSNELASGASERIREELMRFWPSVQRNHGHGWCLAFRRAPGEPEGFSTEQREYSIDS